MEQTQTETAVPTLSPTASHVSWHWLVVSLLLFAAGFSIIAVWLMLRPPGEGSPEATFARDMVAHHEQAVAMALILRDRSSDEQLRRFALDILLTQQAQIGQMQGWLAVWGLPLAGPRPSMDGQGEMMGMASQQQVNELRTLPVPDAETAFLQLMVRHHQGGVAMAQEVLRRTDQPEVVRLATAIIQGQRSEIEYMQDLLRQRGAELPEPLESMPVEPGGE